MIKTIGYGATFLNRKLKPKRFERADLRSQDVELEMLYCGVCHSDIHQVNNDWSNTVYPCVPGHELVGRVVRIGGSVKNFRPGDLATIGCMMSSCGECYSCKHGDEQYCEGEKSWLASYNGTMNPTGQNTYGGYSSHFVAEEKFVLALPAGIPPEVAGPICCAGVTTYSPLKRWGVKKGTKVGVIGLGGLGHMATQIAKAMGADVTVVTTSPDKISDAKLFGASRVVVSTDDEQMKAATMSLDFILNTIPEPHEIDPYVELLHRGGAMVIVGAIGKQPKWDSQKMIMRQISIGGSLIGSLAETKEVLEFCARHKIVPKVDVIAAEDINAAYKRIEDKKARYRYVIDLSSLKEMSGEALDEIPAVCHFYETDKKVKMPQPPVHAGADRQEMKPTLQTEREIGNATPTQIQ